MTEQLTTSRAKDLIDTICRRIDGKPASAKTSSARPFSECASPEWWLAADDTMSVDRNRTTALLTAYVELGGEIFPMTGIPLADGFLRPDRKVMRALVQSGMVMMSDGQFKLTSDGGVLISGHRSVMPKAVALQAGTEEDGVAFGGRGEGENHRALRLWVLQNPAAIFPKLVQVSAKTEYLLPSADRIDVLYDAVGLRFALEVKSKDSNEADLARGIYQCVKYRAVLRAITSDETAEVRAVLVTERALPSQLQAEARRLSIQNIVVTPDRRV